MNKLNQIIYFVIISLFIFYSGCSVASRDWQIASEEGTIQSYGNFIAHYPESDEAVIAKERIEELEAEIDWKKACLSNTKDDYRNFISKHRNSVRLSAAGSRLYELEKLEELKQAEQLKQAENKRKKETLKSLRNLKISNIQQIINMISNKILPYTLAEVRSGFFASRSPAPQNLVSHSGKWESIERTRQDGDKKITVVAEISSDSNNVLQNVTIRNSDSRISILDIMSGNRGKIVAIFSLPLNDENDPIGFKDVSLDENGVTIQYRRIDNKKWTIEYIDPDKNNTLNINEETKK